MDALLGRAVPPHGIGRSCMRCSASGPAPTGRLVETSHPVQKDDAMADDSTTIELSRSEFRAVYGGAGGG